MEAGCGTLPVLGQANGHLLVIGWAQYSNTSGLANGAAADGSVI